MKTYLDINNDSGIEAYEIGADYIDVKFRNTARIYRYSYQSAGAGNVEHMKVLAEAGDGLNNFINTHVKFAYVK